MITIKSTKITYVGLNKDYWAGVFDSDGSITIARRHLKTSRKTSYCPLFQLTWKQSNYAEKAMKELIKEYGGSIFRGKAHSSLGKSNIIKYSLTGKALYKLIQDVLPSLKLKKKQAIIAHKILEYNTAHIGIKGRSKQQEARLLNAWSRISQLNKGVK